VRSGRDAAVRAGIAPVESFFAVGIGTGLAVTSPAFTAATKSDVALSMAVSLVADVAGVPGRHGDLHRTPASPMGDARLTAARALRTVAHDERMTRAWTVEAPANSGGSRLTGGNRLLARNPFADKRRSRSDATPRPRAPSERA